jgi:secondary thiamine-phosphate synthase enzyme
MITWQGELSVATRGRALCDLTAEVSRCVADSGVGTGLCTVFIQHTSASLLIQENADPAVLRDLARWLAKVAPEGADWEHDAEGPDDMPAHARAAITKTSESIPVRAGQLCLGTWQGLYVWEHRARPQQRRLIVHISGDAAV